MKPANTLPDSILYGGLAGRYVATMEPTTEAPPEFHLGAFLTVAGLVFGDARLPEGSYTHHPTLYALLVGPTGQARKTTVANAAETLLSDVAPAVPVVQPEGSRQGITEALIRVTQGPGGTASMATMHALNSNELTNAKGQAVGTPTLLRAGEFTTTLRQSGRSVTGDLTEMWLRLYDRPDRLESNTRHDPLVIVRPVVALLGDATEEALAELFGESNVSNGFLNRISLWHGDATGDPKPRPPARDETAYRAIVAELRALREALPEDAVVDFGASGGDAFDRLYTDTLYPRRNGPDGSVLAREDSQTKRYAMLSAILRGSPVIEADDVAYGWAIVAYLSEGALSLAGKVSTSGRGKALALIETAIQRSAERGEALRATPGYIHRKLSSHQRGLVDNWGVAELVERLTKDGRVVVTESAHEDDGVVRGYYYTPDTVPGSIEALASGTVRT